MLRHRRISTRGVILAAILLVALGFRLWGITWGLHDANVSRRPHPDEWVLYWVFQWFGASGTLNPCPRAGSACFFDWGSVYLYLAYASHLALSPLLALIPPSTFGARSDPQFIQAALAGRVTSALASAATVVVVYKLCFRAYGSAAGLLAASITALSGLLIQLAHFGTPDMTVSLLMSGSLLAVYTAMERPSVFRFGLAGGMVGLTAGTEYQMALLAIPLTCGCLLAQYELPAGDGQLLAPLWLLAAYLCAGLGFFASNPYILVDFPAFWASIEHTIRIRTVDSGAEYQDRWAAYGPSWLYVIRYPLGYGVGWTLASWLLAGALRAIFRQSKADLLLLSWVIPYLLLVTLSTAKFMRYSAPLLPPLAILAGALAAEALRWRPRGHIALPRAIAGAALGSALALTSVYDAAYEGLFTSPDPRAIAARWTEDHIPRGTQVAFEELPDGLINLPYFVSAAGYQPCFSQFQVKRLAGPMRYVMVDSYSLEEHPGASQAQVRRFRDALAQSGGFKLVEHVHYVPTFLGLRFPIDASVHDWRYPARQISIYERQAARGPASQAGTGTTQVSSCYPNLQTALVALYIPHHGG